MVGNYYTLRALVDSLALELPGRAISWVTSQERDELAVGLKGTEQVLVVSCRATETTCFLHPRFARARRNTTELMPELRGHLIERIWIPDGDRTPVVSMRGGMRLVLRLYAPGANVILTDAEGRVLDAFKRATVLRGGVLAAPPERKSPTCSTAASGPSTAPVPTVRARIKEQDPALGSVLTDELLFRAGLDGIGALQALSPEDRAHLQREREHLHRELLSPRPRVYIHDGDETLLFSLVPLQHRQSSEEQLFNDLHEAIRFTVYKRRAHQAFAHEKHDILQQLHNLSSRTERTLRALHVQQEQPSRMERHQLDAELLLAHLHEIPAGSSAIELPHAGGMRRILLDPSISVAQNAQRYFHKARTARRATQEALKRARTLEQRLTLARDLRSAVEASPDHHHLEKLMHERRVDRASLGLSAPEGGREPVPFRVFVVDGGFEVWAGKNSTNNDLLTLRFARPKDLWFHARGAGGSHVVLRTASAPGEPSKRAREQAAAIAAYYSRMRNASLVPVTVTEKKYVRKPRNAPPGTVQVERESVLFAAPRLPEQGRGSP